jgi:hypothetical protein
MPCERRPELQNRVQIIGAGTLNRLLIDMTYTPKKFRETLNNSGNPPANPHGFVAGFGKSTLVQSFLRRLLSISYGVSMLLLTPNLWAAEWPEGLVGKQSVWSDSLNRETQTRFIPTQLYVPSLWSGEQSIELPRAGGTDSENTKWSGPEEWEDPYTKVKKVVYDRRRYSSREGEVVQKMAIRADKIAIGRAFDSRFGGHSCDDEPKFPLGLWKQGEVRKFDYECRFNRSGTVTTTTFTVTITIDEIDFEYDGTPHSLRFTWHLYSKTRDKVLDHKTYTFSPGKGMVSYLQR